MQAKTSTKARGRHRIARSRRRIARSRFMITRSRYRIARSRRRVACSRRRVARSRRRIARSMHSNGANTTNSRKTSSQNNNQQPFHKQAPFSSPDPGFYKRDYSEDKLENLVDFVKMSAIGQWVLYRPSLQWFYFGPSN